MLEDPYRHDALIVALYVDPANALAWDSSQNQKAGRRRSWGARIDRRRPLSLFARHSDSLP